MNIKQIMYCKGKFCKITLLCLLFYLLITFCKGQQNEADDCQDNFSRHPQVKERFDDTFLQENCKKRSLWQKMALGGAGRAASKPILTPAQSAWADKVFQCFDLRCMCQMFDLCKNMLSQIDSSIGNATESLKNFTKAGGGGLTGLLGSMGQGDGRRRRAAVSQVEELLAQRIGKATRKEIRRLTDMERRNFLRVMQILKTERIDTLSKYDIMIVQHTAEYSPGAHFSAAFLPFHREFMKNLEIAMRTVDPSVALPYWDSTLDQGLPDPKDSILWTDDFLGNGNGEVVSGPFANWTTVQDAQFQTLSQRRRIVRNVGLSPFGSLYKDQDISTIMTKSKFRDLVYCLDPFFELVHGANHLWVGGHMNELRISPNDPVFFLLHSFVDLLWEDWRQSKQQYIQRLRDYTNDRESCSQFAAAQGKMRPYAITNADGLSNQYTEVLFAYEQRPTCSRGRPDCGSPYLFCHTDREKCLSKIKLNGNCAGMENQDPCLNGVCSSGRCVESRRTQPPPPPPTAPTTARPQPTPQPQTQPGSEVTAAVGTVKIGGDITDTVWMPITVLALNGRIGRAYPDAKIVTTEIFTNTKWDGLVADASQRPYYTGAAYAQSVTTNTQPGYHGVCAAQYTVGIVYISQPLYKPITLGPVGQSRSPPATPPPGERQTAPVTKVSQPSPQVAPSFSISTDKQSPENTDESDIVIKVVHSSDPTPIPPVTLPPAVANLVVTAQPATQTADNDDTCRNDHRCCPIWAGVGECKRNVWMVNSCKQLCGGCRSNQASGTCVDRDSKCVTWANQGQCRSNDVWMEENCKASCSTCQRSLDDLKTLCGASSHGECVDSSPDCTDWAKRGECEKNPWWMKENCPVACNYCRTS